MKEISSLFGAGTPAVVGSCGQKSAAAKERCCSCEGGSRRQLWEGGGGLMTGAETTKAGRGNAAAQDGVPDPNSFSSCWDWDSPLQLGGRTGAWMAEACAGLQSALPKEGLVSSADPLASSLGSPSAVNRRSVSWHMKTTSATIAASL